MAKNLNINLDLGAVIAEMMIPAGDADKLASHVLSEVTKYIYTQWRASARQELHSTRQGYLRGLSIIDTGRLSNAIVLTGSLNNMLEHGVSSFDMKLGFSKSPKVKYNKQGGWYLHIPFRFAAPTSIGESEAFSGVLPKEIHNVIKSKESVVKSRTGMGTASGLKAQEIPKQFRDKIKKTVFLEGVKKEYIHKTSQFEGVANTGSGSNSQFMSFRTVSQNSDPASWIHKGLKEYDFAGKALKRSQPHLETIVENSIDVFLSS